MADHLTRTHRGVRVPRGAGWLWAMLLPLAAAVAPVTAEELPDPTRPPSVIGSEVAPASEPKKTAGLQSVIISKRRSAAIIDGQTIELGGKYGDVRLIEVSDTGVTLQGARGNRVMTLFPGVAMSKKKVGAGP